MSLIKLQCEKCEDCSPVYTQTNPSDSPKGQLLFIFDRPVTTEAFTHEVVDKNQELGHLFHSLLADTSSPHVSYAITCLMRDAATTVSSKSKSFLKMRETCAPHAFADIEKYKPTILVTFGSSAWHFMREHYQIPVTYPDLVDCQMCLFKIPNTDMFIIPAMGLGSGSTSVDQIGCLWHAMRKAFFYAERGVPKSFGRKKFNVELFTEVGPTLEYIESLHECEFVAIDTETKNLNRRYFNRVGTIQFSGNGKKAGVIPLQHQDTPFSSSELVQIQKAITKLFAEKAEGRHFVMHNMVFDVQMCLSYFGVYPRGRPIIDTKYLLFSLDENREVYANGSKRERRSPYSLKPLALEWNGYDYAKEQTAALQQRGHGDLDTADLNMVAQYGGVDACQTHMLCTSILQYMEYNGYAEKGLALTSILFSRAMGLMATVERNGFWVNVPQLKHLMSPSSPIKKRILELREQLQSGETAKLANKLLLKHHQAQSETATRQKMLFGPRKEQWLFNIDKKLDQRTFFIDALGLEPISRGKDNNPKLDATFQQEYAAIPEVAMYTEYGQMAKLGSSYLKSIYAYLDGTPSVVTGGTRDSAMDENTVTDAQECSFDSRIRAHFSLTASSGRSRSSQPNLQNLPRADNWAKKEVKSMFAAPPGTVLAQLDYMAAEVRWWAILSGDEGLSEAFNRGKEYREAFLKKADEISYTEYQKFQRLTSDYGKRVKKGEVITPDTLAKEHGVKWTSSWAELWQAWDDAEYVGDIHRNTASDMFGIPLRQVTKNQRSAAKAIVFGVMFGRSANSIARQTKRDKKEVQEEVKKFFAKYKKAEQWLFQQESEAIEKGYVESPLGRRRRLYGYHTPEEYMWAEADRQARNSPIQGVASDCCFLGASLFHEYILDHGHYMIDTNNEERDREFNQINWAIVNTVHDSCVFHTPIDQMPDALAVAKECFSTGVMRFLKKNFSVKFCCPIEVEFELGLTYGHQNKLDGSLNGLRFMYEELKLPVPDYLIA